MPANEQFGADDARAAAADKDAALDHRFTASAANETGAAVNAPPAKTYLAVTYAEKEDAKQLGAKWDPDQKEWYIEEDMDREPFAKWLAPYTILAVPFADKDEVKALGAKWDGKVWKVPPTVELDPFAKWRVLA